jgi:nucleosome assembly protein 1-like 1
LVLLCRSTIRDKIIPHAVSWFTGEAVQGDEFEDIGDDDEEDDENDEDDEDEDDDDEEEEGKSRKQVHLSSRFSLILYYFSS